MQIYLIVNTRSRFFIIYFGLVLSFYFIASITWLCFSMMFHNFILLQLFNRKYVFLSWKEFHIKIFDFPSVFVWIKSVFLYNNSCISSFVYFKAVNNFTTL